jgi:hypothetical protein
MTDCRSLWDAVHQIQPSLTERRTLIDLMSIRETLRDGGLRWCPTTAQLADALTKVDRNLMINLVRFMGESVLCLQEASG